MLTPSSNNRLCSSCPKIIFEVADMVEAMKNADIKVDWTDKVIQGILKQERITNSFKLQIH